MKLFVISLLVASPLPSMVAASPVDKSSVAVYAHTISYFEHQTRRDPTDQEAWLNLAMAYRNFDRPIEANAAFLRVLALDNIVLQDRFGDDLWSHTLARRALATQITSR